jgi:hypothetical protein
MPYSKNNLTCYEAALFGNTDDESYLAMRLPLPGVGGRQKRRTFEQTRVLENHISGLTLGV